MSPRRSFAGYALFETAVGVCGIVWRDSAIRGLQLPEPEPALTRERLLGRFPSTPEAIPPAAVAEATANVAALLRGECVDLSRVALDMSGVGQFELDVYEVARAILLGETLTYGEVAQRAGRRGEARRVGQALGRNPWPIIVPCHRVLAAAGGTGGFSAPGGVATKLKLLTIEARHSPAAPSLFADLPLAARPPDSGQNKGEK